MPLGAALFSSLFIFCLMVKACEVVWDIFLKDA